MEREPLAWPNTVENYVGGDFEENNAEGEHLLTDVELVLVDPNIFHEIVRDSVGNVTTIEFCGTRGQIPNIETFTITKGRCFK